MKPAKEGASESFWVGEHVKSSIVKRGHKLNLISSDEAFVIGLQTLRPKNNHIGWSEIKSF